MKEKILYVYGYGSNPNDSFTMKELKKVTDELGYDLISIKYDQEDPDCGLNVLEAYIRNNKIKYDRGYYDIICKYSIDSNTQNLYSLNKKNGCNQS